MESYPSVSKRTWQVFAHSAVAVTHTGDTNETALATIVIPGGTMGKNGILRVTALWSNNNNGNNKNGRIRFGGSGAGSGTIYAQFTNTTQTGYAEPPRTISNRNSEASQVGRGAATIGTGGTGNAHTTSSVDTTQDVELKFTAALNNAADSVTLEDYLVEVCHLP